MMLESSSENNDRMIIRDSQGREYRLQVNGKKTHILLPNSCTATAKLVGSMRFVST
jgi:hypothetical protein